jgi:hypothetical protein
MKLIQRGLISKGDVGGLRRKAKKQGFKMTISKSKYKGTKTVKLWKLKKKR